MCFVNAKNLTDRTILIVDAMIKIVVIMIMIIDLDWLRIVMQPQSRSSLGPNPLQFRIKSKMKKL